jgi:hopanoid biosynthesis associated protein HpnK
VRRLIVTGDDFGLALPVNEAIEDAHRNGILTTASLMVGGACAVDAVERARRSPTLRVGLHVVLVEGRPVLPPSAVPDLVDAHGEFGTHLVRAGFRFFFRPGVRRQLEAEIRAQFEAFRATGLPLDHVNAHNHMHLHPTVMGLIVKVGREFGMSAVRVPYEPPLVSWRAARTSLAKRLVASTLLAPWIALVRLQAGRAGLKSNDWAAGVHDSGNMNSELVERYLRGLRDGVTEIHFHPATRRCPELDRHMPEYRHEAELQALKSPGVKAALEERHVRRVAFGDL